ncbi:MAG: hypothetical protein HYY16_08920 [Planctomycetes bacterium]|nr:hypothetical protein [Planctomycetota bacterium]
MKLAETIRGDAVTEIKLVDGTTIALGVPDTLYQLEYLDDEAQQLGFLVTVTMGRRKGQKAKMVIPYSAIQSVLVT